MKQTTKRDNYGESEPCRHAAYTLYAIARAIRTYAQHTVGKLFGQRDVSGKVCAAREGATAFWATAPARERLPRKPASLIFGEALAPSMRSTSSARNPIPSELLPRKTNTRRDRSDGRL